MVVKGAPDVVIHGAPTVAAEAGPDPLDERRQAELAAENESLGLRGAACAGAGQPDELPVAAEDYEGELGSELGELPLEALVGILDPARPEAIAAIARVSASPASASG